MSGFWEVSGCSAKVVPIDLVLLSLGSETQHLEQMAPVNMPFKAVTDALIGVTKGG